MPAPVAAEDARPAAREFARNHNMHHVTASAREGRGVGEAFVGLARTLIATGVGAPLRRASKDAGVTPGVPRESSSVLDCCRTS